jgi:release factor glutamine methyltransferase
MNRSMPLSEEVCRSFFDLIERRREGEPVQYIVGNQEFMGLDFLVKPGVLIPRGDTEILVEETLKMLEGIKNPIVVDVGCGSGAVGISIASFRKDTFVYCLDIMDVPLEVTGINSIKNGVDDRIKIIKSDMLNGLDKNLKGKIDVVVSNPPYIREKEISGLMRSVKDYEPHSALFGGEDGLYFYRNITSQSNEFIKSGGFIAYEIGYDQGEDVIKILKENNYCSITCTKDLSGLDRCAAGWRR